MSQSQVAEQLEEQLELYEKDTAKIAGKTALKAGGKIFAFFIAKPTAAALAALKDTVSAKTEKSKVTVRDLTANGESVKDLEITDANIKAFEPIARKYGIKYALKEITPSADELKANPKAPPKYMVFFKAKDESVMKAALTEFSKQQLNKKKRKAKPKSPLSNVMEKIAKFKAFIDSRPKNPHQKNKNKER
jgi:hypothetical protein